MQEWFLALIACVVLGLAGYGYVTGRKKSLDVADGAVKNLHSVPGYHGAYVCVWVAIPSLLLFVVWMIFDSWVIDSMVLARFSTDLEGMNPARVGLWLSNVKNTADGLFNADGAPELAEATDYYKVLSSTGDWLIASISLALAGAGFAYAGSKISRTFRARNSVERVAMILMIICSTVAVLTTVGIVMSLIFETMRFFTRVSPIDFFFGLHWSPSTEKLGAVPLFTGTMLIAFIAMLVAVPIGLMSAIYLSEYASKRVRTYVKPALEVLAGIPTVVYGFFAALTVAPFFRNIGDIVGLDVSSESALAAGVVMGIMIVPFISSLSDDVINAVPQSLRDGSYAMGATKSETIKQVVLPAALPGIVGAILLAVSRAVGETMIVVMAAGIGVSRTWYYLNPLDSATTVTVQIAKLLVGDQEFDSAKTLSAFALGISLFAVTLCLNMIALRIVAKYREKYD